MIRLDKKAANPTDKKEMIWNLDSKKGAIQINEWTNDIYIRGINSIKLEKLIVFNSKNYFDLQSF